MAQGTITLTNGSTAVTGAGTDFTTIGSGDFITTTIGGVPYTIAVGAVGSATALTLAIPFDGPTAAGLAFENTGVNTMALATMGVTVQAQKALRLLIADEANWRKIFSNDQQITITTPSGQQITGISWGYLSTLLQNVDPALMAQQAQQAQDGAQQAIAANNAAQQAKTNAETAATNASNANNSAQTAATNANDANNSAQTAKTGAETARDQAEQFANSVNPANLLHKDQNLGDVADKTAARDNMQLGKGNAPTFNGLQLDVSDTAANGGILTSRRVNTQGNTTSESRLYHQQNGAVATTVFHTKASGGAEAYMNHTSAGKLAGVTQYESTPGNGFVNKGGAGNDVTITAKPDVQPNTWAGFMQYQYFADSAVVGLVRGAADKVSDFRISVSSQGVDASSFEFRPQGFIKGRGYSGRGISGYWGMETLDNGTTPFFASTTTMDGGWCPTATGAVISSGGYETRSTFGTVSNGATGWGRAVVKLLGDSTHHRGFEFTAGGDLNSWADSPGSAWGGGFAFTKSPTSDRDLKKEIVYTDGSESYARVMQWLPTLFKYKGSDTQRYGLIAQDLLKVDPQYVKLVPGAPIFEDVVGVDENGEEYVAYQIETGVRDDTLALDSNVMLVDMACAMVHMGGKLAELEKRLAALEK